VDAATAMSGATNFRCWREATNAANPAMNTATTSTMPRKILRTMNQPSFEVIAAARAMKRAAASAGRGRPGAGRGRILVPADARLGKTSPRSGDGAARRGGLARGAGERLEHAAREVRAPRADAKPLRAIL